MARTPAELAPADLDFLAERHLATLTTLRPDGSPHVVAVGFTWDHDAGTARVITWSGSKKYRNVAERPGGRAVVCQVDGGRWLALEGEARAITEGEACRDAVARYAERYRQPKERDDRAVIEIRVDRILGRS
ncbi:MAG TPA: PPOX class F420-dependent oxidoreductase [Acidimicrobiales bacterium]|nr:PPOX class F420-dependent oxidoreductase [Acidimicrobiales bacterium]